MSVATRDAGLPEGLAHECDRIADAALRTKVAATWEAAIDASAWRDGIQRVPFDLRAPGEPLLDHVRRVVEAAVALAPVAEATLGEPLDRDLLLAACILHDVDKVLVFEPDGGGGSRMSAAGRRIGHGTLGAMLCREQGLPEDVVHLVLTHTVTSPIAPEPPEGIVLHYADLLVADAALHAGGAELFMNRTEGAR